VQGTVGGCRVRKTRFYLIKSGKVAYSTWRFEDFGEKKKKRFVLAEGLSGPVSTDIRAGQRLFSVFNEIWAPKDRGEKE